MSKVNVFTADDVNFGKFRWWSNWVDVAVYSWDCQPWLIQMKISRTNKKKFRSVSVSGGTIATVSLDAVGDLMQMSRVIDTQPQTL